jgi:hypothetical protein
MASRSRVKGVRKGDFLRFQSSYSEIAFNCRLATLAHLVAPSVLLLEHRTRVIRPQRRSGLTGTQAALALV